MEIIWIGDNLDNLDNLDLDWKLHWKLQMGFQATIGELSLSDLAS
jgi:hypothetical protein